MAPHAMVPHAMAPHAMAPHAMAPHAVFRSSHTHCITQSVCLVSRTVSIKLNGWPQFNLERICSSPESFIRIQYIAR